MTQNEFIQELNSHLNGRISPESLSETLHFYEQYFQEQKQSGKSEYEICSSLGDCSLIARSILDQEKRKSATGQTAIPNDTSYYNSSTSDSTEQKTQQTTSSGKKIHFPRILQIILTVVIFILIIIVVISLFSALLPFILVVMLLYAIFFGIKSSHK